MDEDKSVLVGDSVKSSKRVHLFHKNLQRLSSRWAPLPPYRLTFNLQNLPFRRYIHDMYNL